MGQVMGREQGGRMGWRVGTSRLAGPGGGGSIAVQGCGQSWGGGGCLDGQAAGEGGEGTGQMSSGGGWRGRTPEGGGLGTGRLAGSGGGQGTAAQGRRQGWGGGGCLNGQAADVRIVGDGGEEVAVGDVGS